MSNIVYRRQTKCIVFLIVCLTYIYQFWLFFKFFQNKSIIDIPLYNINFIIECDGGVATDDLWLLEVCY